MAAVIENKDAYLENFKYYDKREPGNFTPFYIAVAICTVLGFCIFILNIVLGCCSKHRRYWNDRHTGNRWIVSIWTSTAHNQPPIDYTELEYVEVREKQRFQPPFVEDQHQEEGQIEFVELQKRESEI